jgi:hypothetical protein
MDTNKLKADIDAACVAHFKEGHRNHMGASIIGHECARYVWNTFRWLKSETFDGRMYRLFERGQLEEKRFIEALSLVGIVVEEVDKETGKQYRVDAHNGHFGGSLDGIALDFEGDVPRFLVEFKTHGDKSFNELVKVGVRQAKPQHVVQMETYGPFYNLDHGLYCAVNKNTDEFYFEWLRLDKTVGELHVAKAGELINSQEAPNKISETPTYFRCKWCHFSGICHSNHIPEKNCRSCQFAVPIENSEWKCNKFGGAIPKDFIAKGCDEWISIV